MKSLAATLLSPWDYQFWLIFVLTALLIHKLLQPRWKLVPMPHSWPIVGNMLNLPKGEGLAVFANRWAQEINSSVIRLRFGLIDAVVLNDLDSLQETLVDQSDEYAGRPGNTVFDLISDGYQDVAFADANTPNWGKKRKIMMSALRAFSVGEDFEERVYTNWDYIRSLLDENLGVPISPTKYAQLLIYNYLASVCFSVKFDLQDDDFKSFQVSFTEGGKYFGKQLSVDMFKFLKYLPFDMPDYADCKQHMTTVRSFVIKQVQDHMKDFRPDNVRDFTDYLLKAKQEEEEQNKEIILTDRHLGLIVNDVFGAGMATQQLMANLFFHQLAMYPEVQEKAYQEILEVIGNRQPKTRDRLRMPYCEATLQEMYRLGTSHSIAVPRKTLAHTKVAGYDVPKGTLIFPNHASLHRDPAHFPEPHLLKPERFLDNGTVTKPKAFMAFGAGRRLCAGEAAARYTMFLVFVLLVKEYKISPPKGVTMQLEYDFKLNAIAPFEVVLEKRD